MTIRRNDGSPCHPSKVSCGRVSSSFSLTVGRAWQSTKPLRPRHGSGHREASRCSRPRAFAPVCRSYRRLCSDTVSSDIPTLAVAGFALGWSVAWPPGPISAEMVRRGLSRGFWPAYVVGLGASSGDFLWALLITLGAGVVVGLPGVRAAMIVISTALLLVLCSMFLRGAVRSWRAWRTGQPLSERRALDSTRGGYLLGLGM